jgi:hypothetical protein
MAIKSYIVGNSWSQNKVVLYTTEQHAIDDSTMYRIIEAESWKEAKQEYIEHYTTEPENRDL